MKVADIQLRQQRLLIRSTELRLAVRKDLQRLRRPAAWADQLKAAGTWLYQHPLWPLAGLALLLILKPRRLISWASGLWWLWTSARRLRRWRDALVLALAKP